MTFAPPILHNPVAGCRDGGVESNQRHGVVNARAARAVVVDAARVGQPALDDHEVEDNGLHRHGAEDGLLAARGRVDDVVVPEGLTEETVGVLPMRVISIMMHTCMMLHTYAVC